jgi:diguanylate cyclase (GGDEF)-like protein/PAS domain S-box-containing protein
MKMLNRDANQIQGALWLESDTFFFQIVHSAWDTLNVFDVTGNLVYGSGSHERSIGFVPSRTEELIPRIDSEYRIDLRKLFISAAELGKKGRLQFRFKHMNESWIWVETVAIPIKGMDGYITHIAFVSNDITVQKQHESKLIAMAYHDPLTGLPNRRRFKEHINQQMMLSKRTGKMMALLYVDVDDFKMINDTMGHHVGDGFLQVFSERVRGCLREVDIFSRMGGDEFTILLPMMDSIDQVETVLKRIFQSIEQPYELEGHRFYSTVSMGIAMYPNDGEDSNILLKKVDTALYLVKGTGRNAFQFFDPDMYIHSN